MNKMRRAILSLLAVLMAVLVTHQAFAQGDFPREGKHYWYLKPDRVNAQVADLLKIDINPAWTYVQIRHDANLNSPELAAQLQTDMISLRADNPFATLALCETGHEKWTRDKVDGIKGRASQRVWKDCPDDKKYTYVVPGTVLVLKGKKHLTPAEHAEIHAKLDSCETANCVLENSKFFAQNVKDWKHEVATGSPEATDAADKAADAPPPPPPPAPTKVDQTSTASKTGIAGWVVALFGLMLVAMLGMLIVQTRKLGAVRRRAEEAERRIENVESENSGALKTWQQLSATGTQAMESIYESVIGKKAVQDSGMTHAAYLGFLRQRIQDSITSVQEPFLMLGKRLQIDEASVFDPSFVAKIDQRLSGTVPSASMRDVEAKLEAANAKLEEKNQSISALEGRVATLTSTLQHWRDSFVSLVSNAIRSATGKSVSDFNLQDPQNAVRNVTAALTEAQDELRRHVNGVLEHLDGSKLEANESPTQGMLRIGEDIALMQHDLMQPAQKLGSTREFDDLQGVVAFLASDHIMAGMAGGDEALKDREAQIESLTNETERLRGETTSLRTEADSLKADLGRERSRIESLTRELEEAKRSSDGNGAPESRAVPTVPGIGKSLAGSNGDSPPVSMRYDGPAQTGDTMRPGYAAMRDMSAEDPRSNERIEAFKGLKWLVHEMKRSVVFAIEMPMEELPLLHDFAEMMQGDNKRLACVDHKGSSQRFFMGDLFRDRQFYGSLSGVSVG